MAASSFHRQRQSVTVHAALLSLGRQREMCYLHHYATTNTQPCHFVASWRLNYTSEHIIHTSTLVIVFTVRVGKHNFIVLTYLLTLGSPGPRGRHLVEKIIVPKESTLPHLIVFNFNFLAPVVSKIIWGSQICIKGPCAHGCPVA